MLAFSFLVRVIFFTVTVKVACLPLLRVTVTFAVPVFFPVSFPVEALTATTEGLEDFQRWMLSPFPKVTDGPEIVFFSGTVTLVLESLIVAGSFPITSVSLAPQTVQVRSLLPSVKTVASVTI